MIGWPYLVVGLLLAYVAARRYRRARRATSRVRRTVERALAVVLVLLALPPALVGGYIVASTFRPTPEAIDREVFAGVRYERRAIAEPRDVVAHIVTIDLTHGVEFVVTPPEPGPLIVPGVNDARLKTTSAFARDAGADLAINANFFAGEGTIAERLWDLRPRTGMTAGVLGVAASDGAVYGRPTDAATLYLSDRYASMDAPGEVIDDAVSGKRYLVRMGAAIERVDEDDRPDPRTIVALDAQRSTMWWIVIDGRQAGYSAGMTRVEAAKLAADLGASDAIELDGGGSSTLVARDVRGEVRVLNSPIHTRLPGRERPVANHLGVRIPRR